MNWILGDILDQVDTIVDASAPATIHGAQITTWENFAARSNNLARAVLASGADTGDKVAFYMRNRPEYSESFAACLKARLVHGNINYRYVEDGLYYVFDNSDAVVIVYHREFRDKIAALQQRLSKVKLFLEIGDGDCPAFATNYETLTTTGDGAALSNSRSVNDGLFIYTGGTTGMPKGVMWRASDFYQGMLDVGRGFGPVHENLEELHDKVREAGRGPVSVITPPLMHGTGFAGMVSTLMTGGCVVTLTEPSFKAEEALTAASKHRADRMSIVGDAFARPIAEVLDANPGRYDLSSLISIGSSGVMWSEPIKQRLLDHIPQVALFDSFGASESLSFGGSAMTKNGVVATGKFKVGDKTKVFDDNDQEFQPGSGNSGWLAAAGPMPSGYYKDPEKTAKTFREIEGVRYAIPGDRCLVEADGGIVLLGRGSTCINTAGEKVFPEEVEEALKSHPQIADALVVGLPDEKWGNAVTAVVALAPTEHLDEPALRAHMRQKLAGYKVPKLFLESTVALRADNGKANYKGALDFAMESVGAV